MPYRKRSGAPPAADPELSARLDLLVQLSFAQSDPSVRSIVRFLAENWEQREVDRLTYVGLVASLWHLDRPLAQTLIGSVPVPVAATAPVVTRGMQFLAGRRTGAVNKLGQVILDILRQDPKMPAKDVVFKELKKREGQGIVLSVAASEVHWIDSRGRTQQTSWKSLRDDRIPRLRRSVCSPQ